MNKKIVLSFAVSLILANSLLAKEAQELNDITVTAQKTEENMQDVPVSMNVLDEFTIKEKGIEEVQDITSSVSSFSFVNQGTSGVGSPTIRGLFGEFNSFNTPIVTIIDGVPILNGLGSNTTLFDIERVEVLKGPQGTLYGKNAEAGVINIITKKPSDEFHGEIGMTLGNNGKAEISTTLSGALIENKLYGSIAVKQSQKDGFIKNEYTGDTIGDRKNKYAKIALRATPTDNLDIQLTSSLVEYDDEDSWVTLVGDDKTVNSDYAGYNKAKTTLNSLKVQYDINDIRIESITAHKKYVDNAKQDWDLSNPSDPAYGWTWHEYRSEKNNFETLSEEFRVSKETDKYKLLSGIYLDKDEVNFYSEEAETSYLIEDTIHSKTIGIFSHLDYKINDKLSLIGGLRYDKETKEQKQFDNTETFTAFSPKIAAEYNLNQNSMGYFTIAKGYRAGGFNTSSLSDYVSDTSSIESFEQEELTSYEFGMKNNFLNNKLLLNFAVYYMDITNMQVTSTLNSYSTYTSNAAAATSQGIELEMKYKATDNLLLFATLGYNKTKFKDFEDATYDSSTYAYLGDVDYSGNSNVYSPEYTYNIGASYRSEEGYFARVDINGFGSMYTNKSNSNKVASYELVDLKIGYEQEDYDIYLYGKNIFDKEHNIEGFNDAYILYSEEREFGVQLAYRF